MATEVEISGTSGEAMLISGYIWNKNSQITTTLLIPGYNYHLEVNNFLNKSRVAQA